MSNIYAMDHIVLNVVDMDKIFNFYINILGLKVERLEEFKEGKVKFPSLRISPDTLIDLFPSNETTPNLDLNHFCLVTKKKKKDLKTL